MLYLDNDTYQRLVEALERPVADFSGSTASYVKTQLGLIADVWPASCLDDCRDEALNDAKSALAVWEPIGAFFDANPAAMAITADDLDQSPARVFLLDPAHGPVTRRTARRELAQAQSALIFLRAA